MSISTEMFSKEVQYSFLKPAYSQRVSNTHQKAIKITPHPSAPHRDAEKKTKQNNKTQPQKPPEHHNLHSNISGMSSMEIGGTRNMSMSRQLFSSRPELIIFPPTNRTKRPFRPESPRRPPDTD